MQEGWAEKHSITAQEKVKQKVWWLKTEVFYRKNKNSTEKVEDEEEEEGDFESLSTFLSLISLTREQL